MHWLTQEISLGLEETINSSSSSSSSDSVASEQKREVSRLASILRAVHASSSITCADYCSSRVRFSSGLNNANLAAFLALPRPEWARVRWLLVDGVSGDVLQHLAAAYELHPLALDDCLSFQRVRAVAYKGSVCATAHLWHSQRLKQDKKAKQAKQGEQKQAAAEAGAAAPAPPPDCRVELPAPHGSGLSAAALAQLDAAYAAAPRAGTRGPPGAAGSNTDDLSSVTSFDTEGAAAASAFESDDAEEPPEAHRPRWPPHRRMVGSCPAGEGAHVHWSSSPSGEALDVCQLLHPGAHEQQAAAAVAAAVAATAAPPAAAQVVAQQAAAPGASWPAQLILPLHTSAFGFAPSRSPFKHKRIVMQQVSFILHHSGTLITLFAGADAGGGRTAAKVAEPVLASLRSLSSLLLDSEDAAMAMQAVLRSCVTFSLPVFAKLADVVARLDQQVLEGKARMKLTKRLHVLHQTLIICARSFTPMQTLLQTICSFTSHNTSYVARLAGSATSSSAASAAGSSGSSSASGGSEAPVLLSSQAHTYFEDLLDQAVLVSADLAALAEHVAHLNDLVVKALGYSNEAAANTLAVIATLFLPLSFLAGVYGMNWDVFPELHWELGYAYFWGMCAAITLLALLLMVQLRIIKVRQPRWLRARLRRSRGGAQPASSAHSP